MGMSPKSCQTYDIIIVGARCAGSPTAMLLARKGYRVLLLDKGVFPSDLVLSTHLIHPPGIARLQRWGLLDQIKASNCPPLSKFTFDFGHFGLTGSSPPAGGITEAYAPRRIVLDQVLVEAAVEAGATLWEGCCVEGLLTDGERVAGICGRRKNGAPFLARATLVVGADGTHSMLARAVGAAIYNSKPALQCTYFSYWSGIPMHGVEYYIRPRRTIYGWQTNDGAALIGVAWPAAEQRAIKRNIEESFFQALDLTPEFAERVRQGRREGPWIGRATPNYFRKPYGPGWALVGDAGYQKDPCTAVGITDAFRDAEGLAEAIDRGLCRRMFLDQALADYEAQRNERAMPTYEFTCQLAGFQPPLALTREFYASLCASQEGIDRFIGLFTHTISIPEFFSQEHIDRVLAGAPPCRKTLVAAGLS